MSLAFRRYDLSRPVVMEQPPGSVDDLQPQDLSTSSIPTVIDLTRKGEECVLNATSLDALRMVKGPGWFPNSGTGNSPGLSFSETSSSDIALQSEDHIQPDNAFSHTTVTLSYVSRSHVFSAQDSLSQHSPLYAMPPISKFSLHPTCDPDKGLEESGFPLNQHYLEQVEGPVDLAAQTEQQSLSQARVGPEDDGGVCLTQEFNGGGEEKEEHGVSWENSRGLENGGGVSRSSSGAGAESSPETPTPAADEERGASEVLFLVSKKQDAVVGARDLCSLSREYVSPLEDPVSPSATSLDDVEDVFVLPQASSSPSGDNSYPETEEVAWDGLSTEGAIQPDSGISDSATRLDSSDKNKQPVHRRKAMIEPLIDLTDDVCVSDVLEDKPKTVVPHMNGNAKALQRTLKEKKLPLRSSRGTRNSKKSLSSTPPKSPQLAKRSKKEPEDVSQPAYSPQSKPAKSKRKPSSPSSENSKKEPALLSHPDPPSVEINVVRFSPPPPPKSPKKSQGKVKGKATGSRTPPAAKTKAARTPKRRRKKHKGSQSSSMFSPKEPEIKLKYVNYKEEKRELRLDSFSPFVRVERRQSSPSLCTVINYPEEVRTQHRKGQQQQQVHPGGFISAVVPSTSCLQLGRVSMHSQHQRSLVCCLCGQSANAMDLGDLHGPYYPEGYQLSAKTPASASGLKEDEDDYSDSDSSSCSVRGRRRRKCAGPPTPWSFKQKGLLESHRWTEDGTSSPAAKRARSDAGAADVEDWYSPPVLPLEPCEYWLHEDCGIWSAGVFLVKGKVYGLEEAVRVAQETMCSACRNPGATLGCFFKGCPNKYHYRCALESDCVLIEENFSMKCKKHKNKTFKAPPGNRWDDR
ncbi:transcription factor 20-like protein [Lates japonicus]|uniref:Transcription factor 20-like protein n=1 Tax=Lates japonicus TaxID=270547 RepID=A0AAD3MPY6_LATJO|nr:transcription factor 20-like protein [Lates japonicus]